MGFQPQAGENPLPTLIPTVAPWACPYLRQRVGIRKPALAVDANCSIRFAHRFTALGQATLKKACLWVARRGFLFDILCNIEYSINVGMVDLTFRSLLQRSSPMKTGFPTLSVPPSLSTALLAISVISSGLSSAAQQPVSNSIEVQREAMRKLSFLAGHWSGPVTIARGPGEPLHLTQTESAEYKLDGLVLAIEGKSTSANGKALFSALTTIAYDDASPYRFRAYHDGHYVDTELSVPANGFSWSFTAGPAHIVNTMHLTGKGEWEEVTEATVDHNPPYPSLDMLLQHPP
jgi:hypothetical protein